MNRFFFKVDVYVVYDSNNVYSFVSGKVGFFCYVIVGDERGFEKKELVVKVF